MELGYKFDQLLKLPKVLALVGLGRSTLWKRTAEGRFPKPLKIGLRGVAWRASDIEAWLADPMGWKADITAGAK